MLLLVVVEDGHFVALNHELYVFAEGDVGGFGPGEVEFLADDVGFGVGLDGEDLVGVGVIRGVGGSVLGVLAVFGLGVGVVGGGAAGGDFLLLGVHKLAVVPVGGEGEGGGEEKCGQECGGEADGFHDALRIGRNLEGPGVGARVNHPN